MNIRSSKMAVSEQRSAYNASTAVLNFALKAEMQDEGEASILCNVYIFMTFIGFDFMCFFQKLVAKETGNVIVRLSVLRKMVSNFVIVILVFKEMVFHVKVRK